MVTLQDHGSCTVEIELEIAIDIENLFTESGSTDFHLKQLLQSNSE